MRSSLALLLGLLSASACERGTTRTIEPSVQLSTETWDFGTVKVGASNGLTRLLSSTERAEARVLAVTVKPEGSGFQVRSAPSTVGALTSEPLVVVFEPREERLHEAWLTVETNDPSRPRLTVPLLGKGAYARAEVRPVCDASAGCLGLASLDPVTLDVGAEPIHRLLAAVPSTLPRVRVRNVSDVELSFNLVQVQGADAAAFRLEGVALPKTLSAGVANDVLVRFLPPVERTTPYEATLVVRTDDPETPEVRIPLVGRVRPNLPPTVCANLIRVKPPGFEPETDYGGSEWWAPLLVPPPSGYDLGSSRRVTPGSVLTFSAHSAADATACTADPEDGRIQLQYRWRVLSQPAGGRAVILAGETTPQPQCQVFALGDYELSLTVEDVQGHTTSVPIRFRAELRRDLVAQLSWAGMEGAGVDLDLHWVQPSATVDDQPFSGAFAFFNTGRAGGTSGDLNGASFLAMPALNGDYDWGELGDYDDPRLNLDDVGEGPLLEAISQDRLENDPRCATGSCTYKLMVHYFQDRRAPTSATACTVTGCKDGEACGCPSGQRCVANVAPSGVSPTGAGRCFVQPSASVRIFWGGKPWAELPLAPTTLTLGAPCQLVYLADVIWPSRSELEAGAVPKVVPVMKTARFGMRAPGSLGCSPNTLVDGEPWYGRDPP
jgi:hypothetical protein